jgi:MFS family permease
VAPSSTQQHVAGQETTEFAAARHFHPAGTRRRSGLVFPILLIVAGAGAVILSSLLLDGLHGRSPQLRTWLLTIAFQAYVVAAVGVGVMIREIIPRADEAEPLLRKTDTPMTSLVGYRAFPKGPVPGRRLGTGVRALLYLLSAFSPLVGSVAGSILYARDEPDYRYVGKICIMLTAVLLILTAAVVALLYLAFGVPD